MTSMTIHKTAIWLPIVRTEEDFNLLPDGWKVGEWKDFNLHRASTLEKHEAFATRAAKAQGVEIEVLIVKATPQYMLSILADRAYTVASTNQMARLIALAPGFDSAVELGV